MIRKNTITIIFMIVFCYCSPRPDISELHIYCAWDLYANNFLDPDSTNFKRIYPDRPYLSYLEMDAIVLNSDTLNNGNQRISYIWMNQKELLEAKALNYSIVEVDSANRITKLFAYDGIVFFMQGKPNISAYNGLSEYIKKNPALHFSPILLEGYQRYKSGKFRKYDSSMYVPESPD